MSWVFGVGDVGGAEVLDVRCGRGEGEREGIGGVRAARVVVGGVGVDVLDVVME